MATHELTQSVSNGPLTSSSYLFGAVDGSSDSAPDAFLITLVYDYIKSRTDLLYPTLAQYNSVLDTANTALNQGGGYWLGQSMPTTGFADAVDDTGLVTKSQAEAIATAAGVNYVGLPVLTDIDQDNDLIQIYDVSAAGYYSVTPAELRSDVGLGTEDSPTFSGLGLASGAVINWGDLTLTQSSGLLTLAGGNLAVPDDAYAAGWNGSANVPTKNAVYDKIELILGTTLPATYQPLDSDLTSWAGVTRASGFDTFATTPSSANLKSLVTDETGSGGALVFATGPTISGLIATGSPTAAGATWTDLGTVTTADINGGTIDGAIIGGASAAAGTFTAIVGTSLSVGTGGVATVGTIEIGHASANTLAASGGHMTIEGATVWDSGNDGSGSGLDADLLDGKNIGTSGNTVPLLDGTNTWSGVQTFGNTGIVVGASTPFSDSAGTLTLQNVDALDATTESTIEAAIDTLANLTSIQGRTVTLADAGADAFLAWDDSANAYQNLSAADATAILNAFVGDSGSGGTKGLVPAPASGDASKFLRGNGAWEAIPGGGDALKADPLSQFAATTSAQLAGVISDETGSGALVFATGPTFSSTASGTQAFVAGNTADAASVLVAVLQGDRATPATNDFAFVDLRLSDSAGTQTNFARIKWLATDVTDTSEDGSLYFGVMTAGTLADEVVLTGTAFSPASSDGNALGTTALMWSDLFLASGGVINWNNGDVTATHAANALAFAGASNGYSFDSTVFPSSSSALDLGSSSNLWNDLYLSATGVVRFSTKTITGVSGYLQFSSGVKGQTESNPGLSSAPGWALANPGSAQFSNTGVSIYANRCDSDGTIIDFRRDGSSVGNITVTSGTVSLTAFSGAHWGRFGDGEYRDIPMGTILEAVPGVVRWKFASFTLDGVDIKIAYNGAGNHGDVVDMDFNGDIVSASITDEEPDQFLVKHVRVDIATEASASVYGVFAGRYSDAEGWNDVLVVSVGNFWIRMAAGQTPEIGDLVESDENGCAVVQIDGVIRARTVGKITNTDPQKVYEDGSYLVPCVLYCG